MKRIFLSVIVFITFFSSSSCKNLEGEECMVDDFYYFPKFTSRNFFSSVLYRKEDEHAKLVAESFRVEKSSKYYFTNYYKKVLGREVSDESFEDLVEVLSYKHKKGFNREDLILRTAFRFVNLVLDYDSKSAESKDEIDEAMVMKIIKEGKGKHSSYYARIFNLICEKAGCDCQVVDGHSKPKYTDEGLGKEYQHEWNLVKIRGKEYLVDPSLLGTNINDEGIKVDDVNWKIAPEFFVLNHFPRDPDHQLLEAEKVVSEGEFLSFVNIVHPQVVVEEKLAAISQQDQVIQLLDGHTTNNDIQLKFITFGGFLTAKVKPKKTFDGGVVIDDHVFRVVRRDVKNEVIGSATYKEHTIDISIPSGRQEDYIVEIYIKGSSKDDQFSKCLEYFVQDRRSESSSSVTSATKTYPIQYDPIQFHLIEEYFPKDGVIHLTGKVSQTFRFITKGNIQSTSIEVKKVAKNSEEVVLPVVLSEDYIWLTRREGQVVPNEFTVHFPPSEDPDGVGAEEYYTVGVYNAGTLMKALEYKVVVDCDKRTQKDENNSNCRAKKKPIRYKSHHLVSKIEPNEGEIFLTSDTNNNCAIIKVEKNDPSSPHATLQIYDNDEFSNPMNEKYSRRIPKKLLSSHLEEAEEEEEEEADYIEFCIPVPGEFHIIVFVGYDGTYGYVVHNDVDKTQQQQQQQQRSFPKIIGYEEYFSKYISDYEPKEKGIIRSFPTLEVKQEQEEDNYENVKKWCEVFHLMLTDLERFTFDVSVYNDVGWAEGRDDRTIFSEYNFEMGMFETRICFFSSSGTKTVRFYAGEIDDDDDDSHLLDILEYEVIVEDFDESMDNKKKMRSTHSFPVQRSKKVFLSDQTQLIMPREEELGKNEKVEFRIRSKKKSKRMFVTGYKRDEIRWQLWNELDEIIAKEEEDGSFVYDYSTIVDLSEFDFVKGVKVVASEGDDGDDALVFLEYSLN